MGNSKSKKSQKQKEPDRFFEREKWREQKREETKKKKLNSANKRNAVKETPAVVASSSSSQLSSTTPTPSQTVVRTYDSEAIERMRYQMNSDADAFLLNNILLSIQFFENYEKEAQHIKSNPISEREHVINDAMVKYHKHVFFADRLQECVQEHVQFSRNRTYSEPLTPPRYFIIYDNLEACEPGDSSDYSAVLDAPFYKLCIESSSEPGYVKLKQLEILESSISNQHQEYVNKDNESSDSIFTDSEKESIISSDEENLQSGEDLLERIKSRIQPATKIMTPKEKLSNLHNVNSHENVVDISGRRRSGPIKQYSKQASKSNIANIKNIMKQENVLKEEQTSDIDIINRRRSGPIKQYSKQVAKSNIANMKNIVEKDLTLNEEFENNNDTDTQRPRKSILKINTGKLSSPIKDINTKSQVGFLRKNAMDQTIAEDTETSGYRSNSSSLQNSSEPESDYGYSTIAELTTPRRIEMNNLRQSSSSAVLPDDVWTTIQTKAINQWSDDEDDDIIDDNLPKALYETNEYLNSLNFMTSFVENFMMKIGIGLGISQEAVENALTQGASIYCNSINNNKRTSVEIIPALIAAWPNTANQWIIRERKIIQNPRTNFSYQWPTKYMVSKSIGFGCLLIPVGFRPKRGANPEQKLQWRIIFPAAERYLESCLAHSHIRCYLFALTLYKAFLENEGNKIGVDATHIKNHLLWQCEDNYAKWPEDRLGESLRLFLKTFYVSFGHSKFPNYFMDTCNDFKSFPTPLLLKLQRKMADILESPVMHVLHAFNKLTYLKKDYYPNFNCLKLYNILTCKNPLRLLNPNLPAPTPSKGKQADSDDEYDQTDNVWDRAKSNDKNYQWKKEKQRQIQERRKAQSFAKKRASTVTAEVEINKSIVLPKKLEAERRRLVLEFFIPHFIAMARSSEKFDAIKQAIIYLEQAQRLCTLLLEEPAGDITANEYLNVIRDKLSDCQRKLAIQGGYNLPPRHDNHHERKRINAMKKHRPKYENIVSQDSPTESTSYSAFTFVDIHEAGTSTTTTYNINQVGDISEEDDSEDDTESKL